ncbi:MAG: PQQ-binding-like beta-propeller repeat protein [Pirellulaceae bacterium]
MRTATRPAILLTLLIIAISSPLTAQDWTSIRGSDGQGSADPGGILAQTSNVELKVRWKKEMGSGYSSVVVAGDHVITGFTDGEHDNIASLDRATGATRWQATIGPHFQGENGSFDGPIATPLVHDNHVYALDPGGKLVCLHLEDGQEVWSVHLVDDLESEKPLYGFATSPIAVGDTLVVQTGVEEKSLAGFDTNTGEIKWAVSNDAINSQTPVAINFLGTDIVLAAGGEKLTGVDPANGNVLFEYEHGGGNGAAVMPVPIGDNRVVMTLDDTFSKAVSLRPGDENKIEVSEEWQDRSIKNTYNVPALAGGHLFAYSTRILTAVDPNTGQAVWKSREPGDGFLIAIDGHVIINTKAGGLHVAQANGEGYQEVAAIPELFGDRVWSIPAYSDNAIYLRSLGEIACVDIESTESTLAAGADQPLPMGVSFSQFIASVHEAADAGQKSALVDRWIEGLESTPWIEDQIVHFVYRGPGEDVAVASDIFGARQEQAMRRVEGTDLFIYTTPLEPDQRANYMFLVDYQPQTDARNPRTTTSSVYAGEMEFAQRLPDADPLKMSWFGMTAWREPDYLQAMPEELILAGQLTTHTVETEAMEDDLEVEVYLPPQYAADETTRFRSVFIFGGPVAQQDGMLPRAVDSLFSISDVEPAILVFVNIPPLPGAGEMIVNDLIPSLDAEFRTVASRNGRTVAGFGFAAGPAAGLIAQHPDMFSGAALYSPLLFGPQTAMIKEAIDNIEEPSSFYIDWGRFDLFNPHENWDARDMSRDLYDQCAANSNLTVSGGMVNDSTDWASWRNRYREMLSVGGE